MSEKIDAPAASPTLAGARARSLVDAGRDSEKVRALADELALEALAVMGESLRSEQASDAVRRAAARDIMYVWSRIPQPDGPPPPLSPAALDEQITALFREGNPRLLEAVRRAGLQLVQVVETTGEVIHADNQKR